MNDVIARPQDVALLPLPEEDGDLPRSGWWNGAPREGSDPCWLRESVEAYARANLSAALASAQAREEELRAECARLKVAVLDLEKERSDLIGENERLAEALREIQDDALRFATADTVSGDLDAMRRAMARLSVKISAAITTNAATQTGETYEAAE